MRTTTYKKNDKILFALTTAPAVHGCTAGYNKLLTDYFLSRHKRTFNITPGTRWKSGDRHWALPL